MYSSYLSFKLCSKKYCFIKFEVFPIIGTILVLLPLPVSFTVVELVSNLISLTLRLMSSETLAPVS